MQPDVLVEYWSMLQGMALACAKVEGYSARVWKDTGIKTLSEMVLGRDHWHRYDKIIVCRPWLPLVTDRAVMTIVNRIRDSEVMVAGEEGRLEGVRYELSATVHDIKYCAIARDHIDAYATKYGFKTLIVEPNR